MIRRADNSACGVCIDAAAFLGGRLPLVIGVVLALAFLFLLAVFRSVVLPLKAVVMNLLSVGAAYGVMVAVFQWGWLGRLIGIGQTGHIGLNEPGSSVESRTRLVVLDSIAVPDSVQYKFNIVSLLGYSETRDRLTNHFRSRVPNICSAPLFHVMTAPSSVMLTNTLTPRPTFCWLRTAA